MAEEVKTFTDPVTGQKFSGGTGLPVGTADPTPSPASFPGGIQEGDVVPGRGTALPGGGFAGAPQPELSRDEKIQAALSQLETIKKQALELKAREGGDTGAGIVASSDGVVQDERATTDFVGGLQAETEEDNRLVEAHNNFIDILEKEQQRLEVAGKVQITGIEKTFQEAERGAKAAQARETGAFRATLQRIGGFLGESASATGAMLNLAKEQRIEIDTLRQKKAAAIQAANNAINAQQFELARDMAQQALDLESDIDERRNAFFDRNLDLVKEQRAQETAHRAKQKDARSQLNSLIDDFGSIPFGELSGASQGALFEMAAIADFPLELLSGQFETLGERAAGRADVSVQISAANLAVRQASFNLSLEKFTEAETLDALEAERLGLPRGLIGLDENEIFADLQQTFAPIWYVEFKRDEFGETDIPAIQADWAAFQREVVEGGGPSINYVGLPTPTVAD